MGAIAFDLLVRRDGAEDDFSELATAERAVGYTSIDIKLLSKAPYEGRRMLTRRLPRAS